MHTYLFFLGSHPALSATECISVLSALPITYSIHHADDHILAIQTPHTLPESLITTMGGVSRIAQSIATYPDTPNPAQIAEALAPLPPKWVLGISTLNTPLRGREIKKFAVGIKKEVRSHGSKVSFITPSGSATLLNAAQVLFNKLHVSPNKEITLVGMRGGIHLAQTLQIQNIQSYELRDTKRPARDARVGLLPPKLAQSMIHIASAHTHRSPLTILDPFCGMGTVLQEGWLMGHRTIGSDASKRMIAASHENMEWLYRHFSPSEDIQPELTVHDVRQPFPEHLHASIDAIVTEPYLGRPLTSPLEQHELTPYQQNVIPIYTSFFRNVQPLLQDDGCIVAILPAYRVHSSRTKDFRLIPQSVIDEIQKFGYRMCKLLPRDIRSLYAATSRDTLLYSRPDALVAREITVWKKRS